ncbi:MAG: hypothetical protein QOH49_1234 [Acidobacteriota bacterium]|jgi:hypothetical protein|nr:hypothetical protein [Acidobacteriota bacterium]
MDINEVAVATMTWARDAVEERLLRESLPVLAGLGVPVFVTDGGSGEAFTRFLRSLPGFNVCEPEGRGPWAQARQSLRAAHASGQRFILYTESDKADFFRAGLREFVSEAPGGDEVGVVLASRSAESFATFPEFQRWTEEAINRCCAEVVGRDFDFSYGPFLLNRRLVTGLDAAPTDLGWGWRTYAFGVARGLGYRVECVVTDLPCPPGQREDDPRERLYRMRQLSQGIEGIVRSAAAELNHR